MMIRATAKPLTIRDRVGPDIHDVIAVSNPLVWRPGHLCPNGNAAVTFSRIQLDVDRQRGPIIER